MVICDEGGLAEVDGPGAVVVDVADRQEAARTVIRLLTVEVYRDQQIVRGRQHAANFTWSSAAQRIVTVYKEMAGECG